eukprot:6770388-Prymnesium_polylepis.2
MAIASRTRSSAPLHLRAEDGAREGRGEDHVLGDAEEGLALGPLQPVKAKLLELVVREQVTLAQPHADLVPRARDVLPRAQPRLDAPRGARGVVGAEEELDEVLQHVELVQLPHALVGAHDQLAL